jgi:hypothetical protein
MANPRSITLSTLVEFQRITQEIDAFVNEVEQTTHEMLEKKPLLRYLANTGWKTNLLAGLHLYRRMNEAVGGEICINGHVWTDRDKIFVPRRTLIDTVWLPASVAMRQTALMLVEIVSFLDTSGIK